MTTETTTVSAAEVAGQGCREGLFAILRHALGDNRHDVTQLPVRRAVLLLAIPMVAEMLMESLFSLADIFWVSKLGAAAIATVVLTESMLIIVYSFAMGLSMGGAAIVARRVGEEEESALLMRRLPQRLGVGEVRRPASQAERQYMAEVGREFDAGEDEEACRLSERLKFCFRPEAVVLGEANAVEAALARQLDILFGREGAALRARSCVAMEVNQQRTASAEASCRRFRQAGRGTRP